MGFLSLKKFFADACRGGTCLFGNRASVAEHGGVHVNNASVPADGGHILNGCMHKTCGDGKIVCGLDEVGRGPWAGPLVACALVLKKDVAVRGARDSKQLNARQREKIFKKLQQVALYGVGVVSVEEIDKMGLIAANNLAFNRALKELKNAPRGCADNFNVGNSRDGVGEKQMTRSSRPVSSLVKSGTTPGTGVVPDFLLVDGRDRLSLPYPHKTIIRGDSKIKIIACASIIAKVVRDRMMVELAQKYPDYGFDEHKGYGTERHQNALRKFGACAIHRRSFLPVRKILEPQLELF